MSVKLGRNYRITLDLKDGGPPIIISMPFTIRFWMQRMSAVTQNYLSLDIYNLSEENRNRIYQDQWVAGLDPSLATQGSASRQITLELGYDNLFVVFFGTIKEGSNAREGVDIITRIEAVDSNYSVAATQTFQTLDSGSSVASILEFLIGQFTDLKRGAVGNFPDILPRPVSLNGRTWDLLKTYSEGNVFIDNGKIFVLKDNEVVGEQTYTINDASGLLETPRRYDHTLTVTMLMEAGVDMFSTVKLESKFAKIYNSQNSVYKVMGIRHEGTISGAVNGRVVTTLTLLANGKFQDFTQAK